MAKKWRPSYETAFFFYHLMLFPLLWLVGAGEDDPSCHDGAGSAQTCPRAKPNKTNTAANIIGWSLGGKSMGGGS